MDIKQVSAALCATVQFLALVPMDRDSSARNTTRMTALQWVDMYEDDPHYVLAQLEKNEVASAAEATHVRGSSEGEEGGDVAGTGDATYTLTFYGGIQHFKAWFELKGIPEAVVSSNISDEIDYVRYMECTMEVSDLERITTLLKDMLEQIPVYFINMAGDADPMACYLRQQPFIVEATF